MDFLMKPNIELLNEIKTMNLLDAAYNYRRRHFLVGQQVEELSSIFPQHSKEQIEASFIAVENLSSEAIKLIIEHPSEDYLITEKFVKETSKIFPEFSNQIILRYLYWGYLGIFMGTSKDRDLTDEVLIKLGAYDAAALLDNRSGYCRYKLMSTELYPLPALTELFPELIGNADELNGILTKVDDLAAYCLGTKSEQIRQRNEGYDNKKKILRTNNPGFADDTYSDAMSHASRSIN